MITGIVYNRWYSYEYDDKIKYVKTTTNKMGYIHWRIPLILSKVLTIKEEEEKFFQNLYGNYFIKNLLNKKNTYHLITMFNEQMIFLGQEYKINFICDTNNDEYIKIDNNNFNFFYKQSDDFINKYIKLINKKFKQELVDIVEDIFNEKNNTNELQVDYSKINRSLKNKIKFCWSEEYLIKLDDKKITINLQILFFKKNIIKQMIIYSLITYHNKFEYNKIQLLYMENFGEKLIENEILPFPCVEWVFKNFKY